MLLKMTLESMGGTFLLCFQLAPFSILWQAWQGAPCQAATRILPLRLESFQGVAKAARRTVAVQLCRALREFLPNYCLLFILCDMESAGTTMGTTMKYRPDGPSSQNPELWWESPYSCPAL